MPITNELFLRLVAEAKEEKTVERERYCRLGDLRRIDMTLGAEQVCKLLERRLWDHLETSERIRQDQEEKHRARLLRSRQRELRRFPTEIKEVA